MTLITQLSRSIFNVIPLPIISSHLLSLTNYYNCWILPIFDVIDVFDLGKLYLFDVCQITTCWKFSLSRNVFVSGLRNWQTCWNIWDAFRAGVSGFKRTFIWTYEFRQMAISCKWLHISKLILHQLRILYKLRCCWSIHCMKHLWMNWFIVVPRKQYWVMVQKILYLNAYWIRWNFNNACNASCYYCTFFCIARDWCVFIVFGQNIIFILGS